MGYGLADPENDTLIDLVHDVVALLDALAINKAFLIGKDFGALLAYLVTAIHPERISGVVTLVNGSHVASFSLSLLISVFYPNSSTIPNEGLSFLIAPDMTLSVTSHDQYLGLPDVTTDEDPNNHLLAVDLSDDSAFAIKWAIQNYLCPSDVVIFLHVRPTNGLYGGLGSHRRLHLTTSQVLGLSGTF
ncbi:hypothetical protein ACFX10_040894 [Malus domestica]